MKYGVRNQFEGEVAFIKKDEVMSEVILEVAKSVYLTSVMTTDSLSDLGIREGDRVKALIKAVNVVLVKE